MNRAERIITLYVPNEKVNKKGVNNDFSKRKWKLNQKIDSRIDFKYVLIKKKVELGKIEKYYNWTF